MARKRTGKIIDADIIPLGLLRGYWFKVWTGDGHWFRVLVFRKKEQFREAVRRARPDLVAHWSRAPIAFTIYPIRKPNDRPKRLRQIGQIVFSRTTISDGTIAHECLHAALRWWKFVGSKDGRIRLSRADEERVAMVFDRMFVQTRKAIAKIREMENAEEA